MALPSTVQAINIERTGDYDVIRKSALPFPAPAPGDVVIKVGYGGVNFIDTYFRSGLYPIKSFPAVLGTEATGVIVQLPTDERVLRDAAFVKRGFKVGGRVAMYGLGAFAEYVSSPWNSTFPIPDGLPSQLVAASLTAGITAISFVTEAYRVKAGDTVLIHTVAGGLGLVLAQVAKSLGATVIGTTSTKEKAQLAKEHGADHVILYKDEDTVQRVLEITGGKGVEAIYDGVGKDTFDADFKMIKRKGTLISVGNASGAVPPFSIRTMAQKNITLLRPTMGNYIVEPAEAEFYSTQLFERLQNGTLKINIFKEYGFTAEDVVQAQKDLAGGRTTGKLIIRVAGGESTA